MTDAGVALLRQMGFTDYAARAWLALAQAQALTGYEVAKRSNIPRANVYPVLKQLVARGAARRVDTPDGVRYSATPAPELLELIRGEQQRVLEDAAATLPQQPRNDAASPVYALDTVPRVHTASRRVIGAAKHALLVAIQPREAATLAPELRAANARGVKITTLCMEGCSSECGGCCGDIHRCTLACGGPHRWLLVAADGDAAVAAEFDAGDGVRAIETQQPLIVQLVTSYVRQSAALAVLGGELGDRFDGLVSLQARQLLDDLRPDGGFPRQAAVAATEEGATTRPGTGIIQETTR